MDREGIIKIAKAAGINLSGYNIDEIVMGYGVELEHKGTVQSLEKDDPANYIKIAIDHLNELPDYYTRLKKMENEGFMRKLDDALRMFIETQCRCGKDSCDFCDKCGECSGVPLVDGSHPKCRDAELAKERG